MNVKTICKRDGRIVPFDVNKIDNAINLAFNAMGRKTHTIETSTIASKVIDILDKEANECPEVEHVQDIVENTLMANGFNDVAKEYILYRAERNRIRDSKSRLMETFDEITFSDAEDSDIKKENANIDGNTAMGTMLKYGSESSKQFYQLKVMNPDHAKAHSEGWIHIHDMDFAPMGTTTCTQIDLLKLFKDGFSTGHGSLRTPNDIISYSALACIAIQSNQSDQHKINCVSLGI